MQPSDAPPPEIVIEDERPFIVQIGFCGSCLAMVLVIFALLGLTVLLSDGAYMSDPVQVEEHLQKILASRVPAGYRGHVGADARGQRIAVLVPVATEDKRVPLQAPLTIGAWAFPPGVGPAEQARQVLTYWETKLRDELGSEPLRKEGGSVDLTLRQRSIAAPSWTLTCGEVELLAVLVAVPDAEPHGEPVTVACVGRLEDFDHAAMQDFLSSVE